MMKFITKPRIIGVILLIIGIIGWMVDKKGSFWAGLAGIIILIAPTKHAEAMLDLFVDTVLKWKTVIITALYDALYWLFVYGAAYFLIWRIQVKAAMAQTSTVFDTAQMMNAEVATQNLAIMQTFLFTFVGGGVLVFVLCILAYTLSRGMIWSTITTKKPNKKFFFKMFGLTLGWGAIWTVLFVIIAIGLKGSADTKQALLGLLMVAVYFTPIVYTLFTDKNLIGYSISNGLAIGIAKVHKFIIPYTYAFVAYIILYQVFRLLQYTAFMKPASMLFVVLYFSWLRIYIYNIVKKL